MVVLQKEVAELIHSHGLTRNVMRQLVNQTEGVIGNLLQHADSAAVLGSAKSQKSVLSLHHSTNVTNQTMSINQSKKILVPSPRQDKGTSAIPGKEMSLDMKSPKDGAHIKKARELLKRSQYAMLKLSGQRMASSTTVRKVPDRLRFIHNQNDRARRNASSALATELENKLMLSKAAAEDQIMMA